MVVLVFGSVALRHGFNTGITASEELLQLFFVWLTFSGAIVALRRHGHLGRDSLVGALPMGLFYGSGVVFGIAALAALATLAVKLVRALVG